MDEGYQPLARQLYSWLIAPIEDTFETAGIDELMYVLDEGLGHLPMAALMKEETFLG
ncbi:MAG: CHAT domain-containing protein [Cyanobacteria bacterium P01_D01_bin.1]